MRQTGIRGYTGYRGRRPGGRRWLVLVLVLIILAAAAFLIAQHYMVYNTDGAYYFDLPWFRRDREEGAEKSRLGLHRRVELVVEDPVPAEVAVRELRAQELDASVLQGGMSAALTALPREIDAVAVRLKTVKGELLYPSELSAAIEAKAVTVSSIARTELETMIASDYYTIARLSMLHDSLFSFAHMTDAAVLQKAYKNYMWYAPDNSHYLAPEKELTREYLASIAAEVAALGFDELLLDEFGYPTQGRLNNIQTANRGMSEEEALSLLAAAIRESVAESGVRLSLVMDEKTVLDGGNEKSGQDLAALAAVFDRIYVSTTAEKLPQLRAALEPYAAALVPILTEPGTETEYLLTAAP